MSVLPVQGMQSYQRAGLRCERSTGRGKDQPLRYENYKLLYEELKDVKKY